MVVYNEKTRFLTLGGKKKRCIKNDYQDAMLLDDLVKKELGGNGDGEGDDGIGGGEDDREIDEEDFDRAYNEMEQSIVDADIVHGGGGTDGLESAFQSIIMSNNV